MMCRILVPTILILGCLLHSNGIASPKSREIIAQGIEKLVRNEFSSALRFFEESAREDPDDSLPVFFQGITQNRLGEANEARRLLLKAQAMGVNNQDLEFEIAWAELGLGNFASAITRFKIYEEGFPGRGKTSEFLGRAYLALGDLAKAEEHFEQALLRDPRLKETVSVYQAEMERVRGNRRKEHEILKTLITEAPEGVLGRALRGYVDAFPGTTRGFNLGKIAMSASISSGYSDNVLSLGNTTPLPADITRKGAPYGRLSANVVYKQSQTNETLQIGYALLSEVYSGSGLSKLDMVDNFFYMDYARAFSEKISGSLRLSDEYTLLGDRKFRNQIGVRPSVVFRLNQDSLTEIAATFHKSDYFLNTFGTFNRDGNSNGVSITQYVFKNQELLGGLTYTHTRNLTAGSDFSYQGDSLSLRAIRKLAYGFRIEAGISTERNRYDNPNSLAVDGSARKDRNNSLSLVISKAIDKTLGVQVRYNGARNRSNVPFFAFEQNTWNVGMSSIF